jgi:hypothetical protein
MRADNDDVIDIHEHVDYDSLVLETEEGNICFGGHKTKRV